jgi:glycosyltransferase involved in cell wall biosynthesis
MTAGDPILVLTLYPLSAAYKSRLDGMLGSEVTYKLVSELRHGGASKLMAHLWRSRWRRVVIPYEVPEAAGVLSIVQLVAAAHRFPRIDVCDPEGKMRRVGLGDIIAGTAGLAAASLDGALARAISRRGARQLLANPRPRKRPPAGAQRVLYLKNNLWFGLRAGGSVGHVAGVVNGLVKLGHEVRFVSPEAPKYLSPRVQADLVPLFGHFALPPGANCSRMQIRSMRTALKAAAAFGPTLVYQRLSLGDWTGAQVADTLEVPLIVEYNGSEVWVAKNWGGRSAMSGEMQVMEEAILRRADLIFAVSKPLSDELVSRGFDRERVAWYPNCVDPSIYDPSRIGAAARESARLHLGAGADSFVVMFVGTFGMWHGAEVFARAAARLAEDTEWMSRNNVRFAFVGDGKTKAQCEAVVASSRAASSTVFSGLVPQHVAPSYLAAADCFVASHVPNADGSKFFGSPTKLFEYMAMSRPIVASALDQIGEVLEDGRTAVLVTPGDTDALVAGLRRVVDDPVAGARLGAAARAEVLEKYTWERHVGGILSALKRGTAAEAAMEQAQ